VRLSQELVSGSYESSGVAVFTKVSSAEAACAVTMSGACTLRDCTAVLAASDSAPSPVISASAGDITVTGGELASALSLVYDEVDDGDEYEGSVNGSFFAAGDTFSVVATGAEVGAFQASTTPAPADITLLSPSFGTNSAGRVYLVDESNDLSVTWSGGSSGSVVRVSLGTGSGARVLSCDFDASAGAGTVPATLLGGLGSANGEVGTSFAVLPVSTTSASAANASIAVEVTGTPIEGTLQSM
jgi:hypothetical protein